MTTVNENGACRTNCLFPGKHASSRITEYALLAAMVVGGCFVLSELYGSLAAASSLSPHVQGAAPAEAAPLEIACTRCTGGWASFALAWQTPGLVICIAAGGGLWTILRHRRISRESLSRIQPERPAVAPAGVVAKRQALLKLLETNLASVLTQGLTVEQLMSARLAVVPPNAPASTIHKVMQREHVRHLLVCYEQGKLLGIISDRDLAMRAGQTAAELMTSDPQTVPASAPASQAITTMLNSHISCLPVIRDDRVCGILTTTDAMLAFQCFMQLFNQLGTSLAANLPKTEIGERQPVVATA